MKKKDKKLYVVIFTLILILMALNIYKCPFRYIFGLSCPFCGVTRAFTSLLKLELAKSFYYHLLWPLILIALIVHILIEFDVIRLKKKIVYILAYIFCGANLIYYFYRLFNNSSIVYFNFKQSLISKLFTSIF